jgi:hypothetical protein
MSLMPGTKRAFRNSTHRNEVLTTIHHEDAAQSGGAAAQ